MNIKSLLSRVLFPCAALFLFANQAVSQEWHEVKRLGTGDAICKGGVSSVEGLQAFVASNREEIVQSLADGGYPGDPQTVIDAIGRGDLQRTSVSTGAEFIWMARRIKGAATATPNVRYVGKKSHDSYLLLVRDNNVDYQFSIPQICCNLSLVSATAVPVPVAAPAPAPEPEPEMVKAAPMAPPPAKAWWPMLGVFAGTAQCQDDEMFGVEAGILKPISSKVSVLARAGYAFNGSINRNSEDAVFVDIGLEHALGEKAFVGAGVGIWELNESDRREDSNVFVYAGVDTPLKLGGSTIQWFVEGRPRVARTGLRAVWK